MPQPGEMLGGRYRLDDRIAAGGMGEVWRATDTVLGRAVAVKTLLASHADDAGFRSRFEHEARAMAALRHAGVAPVYDYGDTGDGAFLVMARVDGQPLNQRIAEGGPLTPAETMSVVAQAARALAAAHEAGIVHRDVKPGNLIIEPGGAVVLVDFGVARSADSVTLTGVREVVGTALYIAPEQVAKRAIGPSVDIYALGVVAYHCLTGQPPFLGDNPLSVALKHLEEPPPPLPSYVPGPVRDLVERALAKDPEARFPTASAMADAAERAGAALGAAATSVDLSAGTAGSGFPTGGVALGAAAVGGATAAAPRHSAPPNRDEVPRFVPGVAGAGAAAGADRTMALGGGARSASAGHTQAWDMDDEVGPPSPPPPAYPGGSPSPGGSPGRRKLIIAAAAVAGVLGGGVAFAVADPLGLFSEPNPSVTVPAAVPPSKSPATKKSSPAPRGNSGNDGDTGGNEDDEEAPATKAPKPSPTRTTQPATEAPAPTTEAPEPERTTTEPAEEETTTEPAEEEEPTGPTDAPQEPADEEAAAGTE